MSSNPHAVGAAARECAAREIALQKLVTAFICTGLVFLLLPGTFLGVWNLIAISQYRAVHALSAAWIQAHGQAQMFGWIGTFVIGIGFYSLSKMGRLMPFAVSRGWQSWVLWTAGAALHWCTGVYGLGWRLALPGAAALQLAGFLIFFITVRQHRPARSAHLPVVRTPEVWVQIVFASTIIFLLSLILNFYGAIYVSLYEHGPALAPALDQRLLLLSAWGFLVLSVWGFNARWLPIFVGLRAPNTRGLRIAVVTLTAALAVGFAGIQLLCSLLLLAAAALAAWSLHVFEASVQPPKTQGIHSTFPLFVRGAYVWLLVAAALAVGASLLDRNGGITGASRHALTVGFIGTMVFAIAQRLLPAFCGLRVLFSPRLMFYALTLLNVGCLMRVGCEIPAYEKSISFAWQILPLSAIIELTAVILFAINLLMTFVRPPAHLAKRERAVAA
jgi:uncharacterized protein involved in response to NO